MNELMNTNLTMSSREIAELTGKEHKHVLRDIRVIIDQLKDGPDLDHEDFQQLIDARGYTSEYLLTKNQTLLLMTGYSVPLRQKLINRWWELEKQVRQQPQLPASVEVKQLKHELTLANKQLKFEERRKKAEDKLREQVFKDLTRLTKENEELRNNGEIQRLTKENEELRKQVNPLVNDLLQITIKENERLRNLIKTAYEGL